MKIGIDIGNVIIGGGGEDTFFTEKYLETPEVKDAWNSMLALKRDYGLDMHLVSKCGPTTEQKSIEWLDSQGYFYIIPEHRVHFVRKRPLKAPMCQALELDIFIDDRQDIIDSLDGVVDYPILFTSWTQTNRELDRILAKSLKR